MDRLNKNRQNKKKQAYANWIRTLENNDCWDKIKQYRMDKTNERDKAVNVTSRMIGILRWFE